jgi:hypothetical protein
VVYDRSPATVARFRRVREDQDFFDCALAIGAGDCDVQNAVLAAILNEAGVPSRLAIGFVGVGGNAIPGMHAWVEYLAPDGRWHLADASAGGDGGVAAVDGGEGVARPSLSPDQAEEVSYKASPELPKWLTEGYVPVILLAAAVSGLLLFGVVAFRRNRMARAFQFNESIDLAELLRGALRQPDAFAHIGTLFSASLVPLLGSRAISLHRARALASRAHLYRSKGHTRLASEASQRGSAVVDAALNEGEAVAELLGASDLDEWDGLLRRSAATDLTEKVETSMRACGEPLKVRVASNPASSLTTLELKALGVGRGRLKRMVVIDEASRLYRAASAAHRERPGLAVLLIADALSHHLDLPERQRARLLSGLAACAIAEEAHS